MAGLENNPPIPEEVLLRTHSRCLDLVYPDGKRFSLPFEYLRVYTPSAEARGHGPGQETLQVGKREVTIDDLEAVGNYALRPHFSDDHDSGIYSWDLLFNLASHQDELWKNYLEQVEAAGASREAGANVSPKAAGGCGSGSCGSGGCGSH